MKTTLPRKTLFPAALMLAGFVYASFGGPTLAADAIDGQVAGAP